MKPLDFVHFPFLTTKRLTLRPIENSDAAFIFNLRTSEYNNRYLDLPIPESIDDCVSKVESIQKGIVANRHIYWAIDANESKEIIGTICLWNFDLLKERAELGYELKEDAQGQGYMTEALLAVLEYGKENLQLKTIEAYTHEKNDASSKLLKKQGFRIKGYQEEKHSRIQQTYRYAIYSKSWT